MYFIFKKHIFGHKYSLDCIGDCHKNYNHKEVDGPDAEVDVLLVDWEQRTADYSYDTIPFWLWDSHTNVSMDLIINIS